MQSSLVNWLWTIRLCRDLTFLPSLLVICDFFQEMLEDVLMKVCSASLCAHCTVSACEKQGIVTDLAQGLGRLLQMFQQLFSVKATELGGLVVTIKEHERKRHV